MNKEYEGNVWENNPFIDGLFEWMDSPRGQLSDEVREATWHGLKKVDVDATHRKLIWEDERRLSIDESVQRILGDYPDLPAGRTDRNTSYRLARNGICPQDLFPRANRRARSTDGEVGQ